MSENSCCPNCDSEQFKTDLNQYDVLSFDNGEFNIVRSESTDDEDLVFCEGCDEEVDFHESLGQGIIILKN